MSKRAFFSSKALEKKDKNSAHLRPKKNFPQSVNSPVEQIIYLQRNIGNQAVQRLIESGSIQAKLKIGAPNDKYEQEADQVADKVMSMPEEKQSMVNGHSSLVQRKPT